MKENTFISFFDETLFLLDLEYEFTDIHIFIPNSPIRLKNSKLNIELDFLFLTSGLTITIRKKNLISNLQLTLNNEVYNLYGCKDLEDSMDAATDIKKKINFLKKHFMDLLMGKNWDRIKKEINFKVKQ